VIVFGPEGVRVMQVPPKKSAWERLLDRMPGWMERMKDAVERTCKTA